MTNPTNSRRKLLKQVGLGIGLAASASLPAAPAERSRVISKTRQLLKTDVLVVGGGPAGIGAALGAARTGVKTLLVRRQQK